MADGHHTKQQAILQFGESAQFEELRLIEQYSTHLIDGTMPFRMIDGRQVFESLGPPTTTYYPTRILPHVTPTSA